MLGADGKEYGPITAEQLRQWIAEGRANGQTSVLLEGASEWKVLAEFPEFAEALRRVSTLQPASSSLPGSAPPSTNGLAVTSLVMGIISITCGLCCYGFPFNLLGIIFALIALSQIKSDPVTQQGRGLALVGLLLCILSIVISAVLFVLGVALNGSDIWKRMQL
jgi:hypothetical protein